MREGEKGGRRENVETTVCSLMNKDKGWAWFLERNAWLYKVAMNDCFKGGHGYLKDGHGYLKGGHGYLKGGHASFLVFQTLI